MARLPAPQMPAGGFPTSVPVRVRWSDDDRQGVLNNAAYLTLLEEARHELFREVLVGRSFPFVLAQSNVAFLRPGHGGCTVEVLAATLAVGSKSITQAYRVVGPDGTPWCEADAVLVAVGPDSRAAPLSDALRGVAESMRPSAD